jgi:hypothetical protein
MINPNHPVNVVNQIIDSLIRSERLKGVLKEVFSQVVKLLVEKGIITLKEASEKFK